MAVILHIFRFPSYAGTSPMRITTIHSVHLPLFLDFIYGELLLSPQVILTAFIQKINSYFGKIFATFLSRFCFSS